tara:strand:- start:612 stop:791 length:180 start_codon:yes stop_codon:yes gene_type:complete
MAINSIQSPTHLARSPSSLKQPSDGQKNAGKRVIKKTLIERRVEAIISELRYSKMSREF